MMAAEMTQDMNQIPIVGMAMNLVVVVAILFAAVFVIAWVSSYRLRQWIERPNYQFRENARIYDQRISGSLRL